MFLLCQITFVHSYDHDAVTSDLDLHILTSVAFEGNCSVRLEALPARHLLLHHPPMLTKPARPAPLSADQLRPRTLPAPLQFHSHTGDRLDVACIASRRAGSSRCNGWSTKQTRIFDDGHLPTSGRQCCPAAEPLRSAFSSVGTARGPNCLSSGPPSRGFSPWARVWSSRLLRPRASRTASPAFRALVLANIAPFSSLYRRGWEIPRDGRGCISRFYLPLSFCRVTTFLGTCGVFFSVRVELDLHHSQDSGLIETRWVLDSRNQMMLLAQHGQPSPSACSWLL